MYAHVFENIYIYLPPPSDVRYNSMFRVPTCDNIYRYTNLCAYIYIHVHITSDFRYNSMFCVRTCYDIYMYTRAMYHFRLATEYVTLGVLWGALDNLKECLEHP